ncbi:MAG: TatD family hydrolase [Thermostichales cyanobacterium SZTDM-1c_bins_54]
MQLVDTHVHLNFPDYGADLPTVAQQWRQAGVKALVHACVRPDEFPQLQAIAAQFPEVFLAIGLHPLEAAAWDPGMLPQMRACLGDPRVVAVGETGLDFYKAAPELVPLQVAAFQAQIELAQVYDRALIVHCRDAAEATYRILRENRPQRVVMHCWSGTPEQTAWFVELGCAISFSGIVTFKNARSVQEAVKVVPDEQLLIETDCPFLAPVPHRGKRNQPAYVAAIAAKVAELRGRDPESLGALTTANACRFFRLPDCSVQEQPSKEQAKLCHPPSPALGEGLRVRDLLPSQ